MARTGHVKKPFTAEIAEIAEHPQGSLCGLGGLSVTRSRRES
jgi:hypothetical protein